MKVNKLVSLDYELAVKLKDEKNASGLINSLLSNHYTDHRKEVLLVKKAQIDKQIEEVADKEIKENEEALNQKEQQTEIPASRQVDILARKIGMTIQYNLKHKDIPEFKILEDIAKDYLAQESKIDLIEFIKSKGY